MSRNLRYWSKFSLQNLFVPGLFLLIALALAVNWSADGPTDLTLLPGMVLAGMLFSFICFGCGIVVLYLPLLVSMGETRRNVLLGYHYYLALSVVMGTALWAVMMWIAGAGEAILSGLVSVMAVQVVVAAAGSLIGIVYARYKWVGVLMIALLSGGTAGIFSFLVASRGRDGIALIAGFLSPEGLWLLIAAAVLAAVEIAAAWLHFRRREVKL